jgi:hypothetical protein
MNLHDQHRPRWTVQQRREFLFGSGWFCLGITIGMILMWALAI